MNGKNRAEEISPALGVVKRCGSYKGIMGSGCWEHNGGAQCRAWLLRMHPLARNEESQTPFQICCIITSEISKELSLRRNGHVHCVLTCMIRMKWWPWGSVSPDQSHFMRLCFIHFSVSTLGTLWVLKANKQTNISKRKRQIKRYPNLMK